MAHETDCGLVHHVVQDHQVVVLEPVLGAVKVVVKVVLQFSLLGVDVGEVDEEPGAHVALHVLDLLMPGGLVAIAQEVAVLQESSPADLLRVLGGYQLLVQVVEGFMEVSKLGLAHDSGVEVITDGHLGTAVEQEEGVQQDVEAVHRELVLPSHGVHKLELHTLGPVVAQGDKGPPVAVVDLDHLADVGLLHAA